MNTFSPTAWQASFTDHIAVRYEGKTLSTLQQHIRHFSAWYAQAFQREIDPQTLTNYALKLYRSDSEKKVAVNTWNGRRWALGILAAWLERPEILEGVELMEQQEASSKHRALTQVEYRWLNDALEANIDAAKTDEKHRLALRDRALVHTMLHCLTRVFEATALRWEDIIINDRSGEMIIRRGKGAKRRIVQMNKHIRASFLAWKDICGNPTSGPVFPGDGVETLTTRTAQRIAKDLAIQINVPDLTCHWLRYTGAKTMERHNHERGLHRSEVVRLVQNALGHSTWEMTDRYLRSGIEERQSAMDWE